MLCMSKTLKMVFVAFTQHCIQSTDFILEMLEILYSVNSGPSPLQGGKGIYLSLRSVGLAVHHQSVRGGSFVTSLDLTTTRVIAGKTHSQSNEFRI